MPPDHLSRGQFQKLVYPRLVNPIVVQQALELFRDLTAIASAQLRRQLRPGGRVDPPVQKLRPSKVGQIRDSLLVYGIRITRLQDLSQPSMGGHCPFAGKRGGRQGKPVFPSVNDPVPTVVPLKKSFTEFNGPTQEIVAGCDFSINSAHGINTQIDLHWG
jgi:hypothetical protein